MYFGHEVIFDGVNDVVDFIRIIMKCNEIALSLFSNETQFNSFNVLTITLYLAR